MKEKINITISMNEEEIGNEIELIRESIINGKYLSVKDVKVRLLDKIKDNVRISINTGGTNEEKR